MPENIGSLDVADTGVKRSKPPVTSALGGKSLRTKTSLYSASDVIIELITYGSTSLLFRRIQINPIRNPPADYIHYRHGSICSSCKQ